MRTHHTTAFMTRRIFLKWTGTRIHSILDQLPIFFYISMENPSTKFQFLACTQLKKKASAKLSCKQFAYLGSFDQLLTFFYIPVGSFGTKTRSQFLSFAHLSFRRQ
mmetsp:Transcript_9930/g.22165  ORF Transcript_9930/g.22165 Transcript_9930/m.22165 type:complete len:106 (+) Transcript_9930:585-902(+)